MPDPMTQTNPEGLEAGLRFGDVLTAENVGLLERGDWLLHRGKPCLLGKVDGLVVESDGVGWCAALSDLAFLARPGVWQDWSGGENPAGDLRIEYKMRGCGDTVFSGYAANIDWDNTGIDGDIIAWRIPVGEGRGSLRAEERPSVPSRDVSDSADRRIAALEHEIDLLNEERRFWRGIEGVQPKPDRLAETDYERELYGLWQYATRQRDVWRGIASAMGYEPNAHDKVKPTEPWLLERIANYRAALSASGPSGGGGAAAAVRALLDAAASQAAIVELRDFTSEIETIAAALSAPGSEAVK